MNEENLNEEQLQEDLPAEVPSDAFTEAAEEVVEVTEEATEKITEEATEEATAEENKTKGNRIFTLFITLFCLLVGFLSLYGFMVPDREFSENESRLLESFPAITLSGVLDGSFMKSFEAYLTDQFPFRDGAIYIKSLLEGALGKNEENGAYIGKNGFLFEKQTPYTEEEMNKKAEGINAFIGANKGIKTVFALVPNSSFIYAENLPDYLETENQQEQIDKFYAQLDKAIVKTDTVTALLEAKSEGQVFYKSDHHWTTYGAFSVFEKIMEGFGESVKAEDFEFHTVSNSFEGTLKSKSPAQSSIDSVEVCFPRGSQGTYFVEFSGEGNKSESLFVKEKLEGKNHYEVFLGGNYAKTTVTTTLEGDRKLLLVKDSFANCLIPMLTPYFSKIVVVDPRYMTEGIDGIMNEDAFTDILFLYNANTFFDEAVLGDVLGY